MSKKIKYCSSCDKYTLKDVCTCGQKTLTNSPPKYSPEDRMAKYRRQEKEKILKEKGLL